MSLHEAVIFSDPVLQRVFFDERLFAPEPGHEVTVNDALYKITGLKVQFYKATSVEECERIARQMRHHYFRARRYSMGYRYEWLENLLNEPGRHTLLFEHDEHSKVFSVDYRARAAYRHRFNARQTVQRRYRPSRT